MSFHFTNLVKDKEGTGNELIQYSYITLKQDALHWLKETGRLPSSDIDEYFEEIKQMKEQKEEIKQKDAEIETIKEEKEVEIKAIKEEKEAMREKKDAEILALKA